MAGTTARAKVRLAKLTQDAPEEMVADDGYSTSSKKDSRLNPLADLIDDETFAALQQLRLIDQKSLRDFEIRKTYREMRERMSASDAIDKLQKMHPYLQFDTIRKIVYMAKAS